MNNITVDGSYFNNSFGLGGQPGDRTNVCADLDGRHRAGADQRRALRRALRNFVAGVNTVTRSGTNNFRGSGFYQWRDEGLTGTERKTSP